MGSRTAHYLALRLLHRHLPLSPAEGLKHAHLRAPLPVAAAGRGWIDPAVASQGRQQETTPAHSEKDHVDGFMTFLQPTSPLASLSRLSDAARVPAPVEFPIVQPIVPGSESRWGFRLGFELQSGMFLPAQHDGEGMEASSVKRKRKKKMNKHKQRKLRRRDRHRN